LLFEGKYGRLRAIIDASSITQIRTAAASGLATKYLARYELVGFVINSYGQYLMNPSYRNEPNTDLKLAILGSGVQAESHLEAMLAVR